MCNLHLSNGVVEGIVILMATSKKKKKKSADAGKSVVGEEEVVFEDVSDAGKGALEKAKKALKTCEQERKEYLDGWKRAKADALNEKKRQREHLDRERAAALQQCVVAMLPVFDSVRAALDQVGDDRAVRSGAEQIHTQCLRSFADLGVTLIDTVGEVFDPLRHQSVGEQKVPEKKNDNTVAAVMRVGASINDVVIRPAMVYVGVYKKETA